MKKISNNSTKHVLFKKIVNLCKNNKKIAILFLLGIIMLLVILSTATTNIVKYYNEKKRAEQMEEVSYKVIQVGSNLICKTVITFANPEGIKQITLPDQRIINANGKMIVAMDFQMQENHSYDFDVVYKNGYSKTLTVVFKIPRIEGNYLENNALYLNAPDLSNFEVYNTRYMYMNEDEKLVPGSWIDEEPPENWYDYSDRKWANILVESEGEESYFVWVPRYCYKVDKTTQRTEILFINMDNEFKNKQTGETISWDELEEQGYVIPEAFTWYSSSTGYTYIPGYWISKYQLAEKSDIKFDWEYVVDMTSITVNITKEINVEGIKFLYAINGEMKPITTNKTLTFNGVSEGTKFINVTALNSDGTIYASMTKKLELAAPNPPELDGFDKDTTFYVYYDSNNNEYNEIPISMNPPGNWYNYTAKRWANIVTRNNGIETYLVWIPRFEYYINPDIAAVQAPNQRVTTKFLNGTEGAEPGYAVPEAFTFNGRELTGYWITKYQLNIEDSNPRISAQMSATSSIIRILGITGTELYEKNENNETVLKPQLNIEYYINGVKKYNGTDINEHYNFTDLEANHTYVINIIVRDARDDSYIGSVTRKVKTIEANKPDISKFEANTTYYVVYDNDSQEIRVPITENEPANWYDYSNQKWANIVTTANGTETYWIWVPRYEYRILSDRDNLDKSNRRVEISFLEGKNQAATEGYSVPEAFTFNGEQITGYWITKYQLGES